MGSVQAGLSAQLALIYGQLIVLSTYSDPKSGHRMCVCRCSCGGSITARDADLRRGHTVSCGCRKRTARLKHGAKHSRTYQTWMAMRRRCYDPKFQSYPNYGGRGVRVWPLWNDPDKGYEQFVADMGERPPGMTLDRRDPYGHYIPSNVRWATDYEQQHNKRRYVKRLWDLEMAEGGSDAAEDAYWDAEEQREAAEAADRLLSAR